MNRAHTQVLTVLLHTVLVFSLGWACSADAQTTASSSGTRIWSKLQQNGLLDSYFPEAVLEVAEPLRQAAQGQWLGVQVNGPYREGWINLYTIDAQRLRDDDLLAEEGLDNFTPESLQGGALTHVGTGIIFLNTTAWKRLAAATFLTQTKVQPDLTAALATIDAVGLEASRELWDQATLSVDTQENQRIGWLLRGALAFVLAHEMGHMRIDNSQWVEAPAVRPQTLTNRQKDERYACPEALHPGFQQQQRVERAADLAAVELLGQQCRIGADGQLRHAINMLGTTWYFLFSMSDKLIQMGRNTSSPIIAQAVRQKIGPVLYQQVIVAHASQDPKGAVKSAYPSTHPPDTERMRAIEAGLRSTPCGSGDLDSSGAQMLEIYRLQMCRGLLGQGDTQ